MPNQREHVQVNGAPLCTLPCSYRQTPENEPIPVYCEPGIRAEERQWIQVLRQTHPQDKIEIVAGSCPADDQA